MPNSVVTFSSSVRRKVRGTDVKIGDNLYAIQDDETGMYFIWCYTNEVYANRIANRVVCDLRNVSDIQANWRAKRNDLVPSCRDKD